MRLYRIVPALLAATFATPLAAQPAGEESAVIAPDCERECLLTALRQFRDALAAGDASRLPLAGEVTFTENNVPLPLDKGLWSTVTAVDATGVEAADPRTGNAAWFGSVKENGKPAIYAVRIHLSDGRIDEIETIVHRKTALPAPFGDTDNMVHDPEYNDILPVEERASHERMMSIADGYFDTVQLNDGHIFTYFSDDCGRLENGIRTTSNNRADGLQMSASGCENQFKMGIYRINKRVRREFFIIDEERGVAVARGFFDHANEFDRYNLTNGQEMKTLLKWPNTISMLEVFRIKDQKIQRIEAVFTYVPYFMHNPFSGPDSQTPQYAPQPDVCGDACLADNARALMNAYPGNKWDSLNWADKVGYAENSVGIWVGESVWRTATAVDDKPLVIADGETGKAVWVGRIDEHGQPAWAVATVTGAGKAIGSVDLLVRRKEYGHPWADPGSAPSFSVLPAGQRTSRDAMLAGADGFFEAVNRHDGTAPATLAANCTWTVNGQQLTGCAQALTSNGLFSLERVRDRRVLAVDEERGLVAVGAYEDWPSLPRSAKLADGTAIPNSTDYPMSQQIVEIFRFESGKITQIVGYASELPYGMKPHR